MKFKKFGIERMKTVKPKFYSYKTLRLNFKLRNKRLERDAKPEI